MEYTVKQGCLYGFSTFDDTVWGFVVIVLAIIGSQMGGFLGV
tara:strand:- start:2673 stop:2798 length:126 start_codon:yes stop_codon:yes gene_type:complete